MRRRVLSLFGAILVIAGATAGATASAAGAGGSGCLSTSGVLTQTMNGRLSGCLLIAPLAAGAHTVVLEQIPLVGQSTPPGKKLPKAPKLRPPNEPAGALTLSPSSGGPGTKVTITGRLSAPRRQRFDYPNFCWDGCLNGLGYAGIQVRWKSSREFTARLVVPAAPWIEGGPVRIVPLTSGRYPIGVQCLVEGKGCSGESSEGTAYFALRVPSSPGWCRTLASCAVLHVSPGRTPPGATVRVSGYAPLVSVTGADQPFVFELEVIRGRPHGDQVVLRHSHGETIALFGHAGLRVSAPPTFASLAQSAPIAQSIAGVSPIAGAPGDPSLVAWCGESSIAMSDAGVSATVSTAAAGAVLKQMGFDFEGSSPPCVAVVPTAAGSVVAAFAVGVAPYGAPPDYDVALVTSDGGTSWTALPVPERSTAAGFGGFRETATSVIAVFSTVTKGGTPAYPDLAPDRPVIETTADAGATWTPGALGCPAAGPCLTLAAFELENCAMIGETQDVLRSTDGGASWSEPFVPSPVDACSEAELAATSSQDALLIDTGGLFPLLASGNGGLSWHDVALPRAPHQSSYGLGLGPGGLTLLPDGALLLSGDSGYSGGWELLVHGSKAWCHVQSPGAALQNAQQQSALTVIGTELWWLTGAYGQAPTVQEVPLASIAC